MAPRRCELRAAPAGACEGADDGLADPLGPGAFLAYLEGEIERLEREGGFATIVLHLFMLDWLGEERLATLLDRIATTGMGGDLWVATCAEVAAHLLSRPRGSPGETVLDSATWSP